MTTAPMMTAKTGLFAVALLGVGMGGGYVLSQVTSHGGHDMRGMDMGDGTSQSGGAMQEAMTGGDGPCPGGAAPEYWVAPMDSSFRRDAPGKSPMGMELVPECGGADGGADVTISPQVEQNLGVRTATVQRGAISRSVRAVGTVGWNEDSFRMIHTRAEGWLERLGVAAAGESVAAGDLLFGLFAPKLAAAEREYLAAGGNRLLRDAAADRLRALGYTDAQVRAVARRGQAAEQLERRAPADLTVVALGARQGQFVMPGTHVMTLANLSTVWLTVAVPERDAGRIRVGQPAVATVAAHPERTWEGQVDHVYPQLDAMTRSLRVRLAFDNADGALKPDMFAAAVIQADTADDALIVPTSAVIRTGTGARVVKAVGDGGYDVVAVRTGYADGQRTQVLAGLAEGERVVTSGQFLIDSEANVDAEALRLASAEVPAGKADATVQSVDAQARSLMLKHGAFEPVGADGMAMPGMTMGFGVADDVDLSALQAGDRVRVTVENPGPGTYTVTEIVPAGGMDHGGMDHGEMSAEMSGEMTGDGMSSADMTDATVRDVDAANRRITLEHQRIESLAMPAMTMGFDVAEDVDLSGLQAGDAIRFSADNPDAGVYRVIAVQPAE